MSDFKYKAVNLKERPKNIGQCCTYVYVQSTCMLGF